MDPVKALKQIYLFRDLPEPAVKVAAQAAESLTVEKGEVIVEEGRPGDALYVLRGGSVRVFKRAAGDRQDVVILGTGSHFGEMALLDESPRSATVEANEHCELLVLKVAKLRAKVEANHEIAHHLYRALARSLAQRLRQTTDDLGFARQLVKERGK